MEIRLTIYTILIILLTSAACVVAFNLGQLANPILASHGVQVDIRGRS